MKKKLALEELFIVSAVYWGMILIVFLWLGKRLSDIEKRLNDVRRRRKSRST